MAAPNEYGPIGVINSVNDWIKTQFPSVKLTYQDTTTPYCSNFEYTKNSLCDKINNKFKTLLDERLTQPIRSAINDKNFTVVNTLGGGDCFFHAWFTAVSPLYRRLDATNKNTAVQTFRPYLKTFLTDADYAIKGLTKTQLENVMITPTEFMEENHIAVIAVKFKINFLFFVDKGLYNPQLIIKIDASNITKKEYPWVYTYNTSQAHYSAIKPELSDDLFITDYKLGNQLQTQLKAIDFENIGDIFKSNTKSCVFTTGSTIVINDVTDTVDEIRSLVINEGGADVNKCYVLKLNRIDKPVLLYKIKSIPTHTSDKIPKLISTLFDKWTIQDFGNYMNADNIDFAKPLYTIVENPSNTFTLTPIGNPNPAPAPKIPLLPAPTPAPKNPPPPTPTPPTPTPPTPTPTPPPSPPIKIENIMFEIECIIYKLVTGTDCVVTTTKRNGTDSDDDEEEDEDGENTPVRINETISIEPPSDYHVEIISTNTNVASDGRLEPGISTSEYITIQNENI